MNLCRLTFMANVSSSGMKHNFKPRYSSSWNTKQNKTRRDVDCNKFSCFKNKQIIATNDLCTLLIFFLANKTSSPWDQNWILSKNDQRIAFCRFMNFQAFISFPSWLSLQLFFKAWFVAIVLQFLSKLKKIQFFVLPGGLPLSPCSGSESIHFHIFKLRIEFSLAVFDNR